MHVTTIKQFSERLRKKQTVYGKENIVSSMKTDRYINGLVCIIFLPFLSKSSIGKDKILPNQYILPSNTSRNHEA